MQLAVGRALGCGWCNDTYLARTIRVLVQTVPIIRSTYVRLVIDRTAHRQYYVIGRFLFFTHLFVS